MNIWGFQQSFDLDKYLRVPLLHKVFELTNGYVVDKVQERISSQSTKALAFTSRKTPSKLVLSSIAMY